MPMRHVDDDSRDRWSAMMVRKLRHFSATTLKRACDDIISNRKSRGFPSMAEMLDACAKAMHFDEAHKPSLEFEPPGPGKACDAYIVGEGTWEMMLANGASIVNQAAKEDCQGTLRAFVIRKGRLPNSLDEKIQWFNGEDPHSIRVEKKKFDEAYRHCVRFDIPNEDQGDWQKLGDTKVIAALRKLGDAMLEKREDLRTQILGKGV